MCTRYWFPFLFLSYLFWSCTATPSDKPTTATRPTTTTAAEMRTFQSGHTQIRLVYQSAQELLAMQVHGTDTSRVTLRGDFQPDGVLGCDSCLLVYHRGGFTQLGGYAVNDSLFLLTVVGTNWRLLLYGINFSTQSVLETAHLLPNDHLETYLPAFVLDTRTGSILTADRPQLPDESERVYPVVIHRYQLGRRYFTHRARVERTFTARTRFDSAAMQRALRGSVQP